MYFIPYSFDLLYYVLHHVHIMHTIFFFNDTSTTDIYTLSLHDALPIFTLAAVRTRIPRARSFGAGTSAKSSFPVRSEEHTSELQSHSDLVCRLLLEKKKYLLGS